jgi:hypothetical protein
LLDGIGVEADGSYCGRFSRPKLITKCLSCDVDSDVPVLERSIGEQLDD